MNNKELGFVIKRFAPKKQKFSILSHSLGKIEIIPFPLHWNNRLRPGMLISSILHSSITRIYIAHNIEILLAPLDFTENTDIYWIHSILELCYYFLPLESPCQETFNFVYRAFFILNCNHKIDSSLAVVKKLLIVKLLTLFGFYPQKTIMRYINLFEKLVTTSVDFTNKGVIKSLTTIPHDIDKEEMALINSWILQCLNEHPNFSSFKLLNFLTQNEPWEL